MQRELAWLNVVLRTGLGDEALGDRRALAWAEHPPDGWMVAAHENARVAQRLIDATCRKQGIGPNQLTIHADRGAPMRSKLVAELFSDLSIDASHSRPA
jgi:hypothetical protein